MRFWNAQSISRWPRAVAYCIGGGSMFSCGALITISATPGVLGQVVRGLQTNLTPEGGGFGAVLDAGIRGALVGGLLGGLGPLLAYLGIRLYNRGRKIGSRSAPEVLGRTSDRPVLYLRSFNQDALAAAPSNTYFNVPTIVTQEEQIVGVLERIGPVVAIGRPGEKLPELGAARLYVQGNENEWRVEVTSLMRRANLIAIRASETEGVLWEIQQAVSLDYPQRLVMLIPLEATQYKQFSTAIGHLFPRGLPEWPSTSESREGSRHQDTLRSDIKAVVHFSSQWEGTLNCLAATRSSAASTRPLEEPFSKALQPVFEGLAVEPKRVTTVRRTARAVVTVFGLIAGLVPGVVLAVKIGPALEPLAGKVYALHIFSKTRADQIAEAVPGPLGPALRDQINQNESVRTWVESATNSELKRFSSHVASGMPRLSNELLDERANMIGTILTALDTERCGVFVRTIAGLSAASPGDADTNVLHLLQTHLGRQGLDRWAYIIVKSIEADLTNIPAQRVTEDSITGAVTDVLNLLSDKDRTRLAADLQRYASLQNGEICWVERTLNQARPRLSPESRVALLRAPLQNVR